MAIVHFVNYKRGTQSRAAMRGVMLYVMQERNPHGRASRLSAASTASRRASMTIS